MLSDTDDAEESWATKKSDRSFAKGLGFVVKLSGKSLIHTQRIKVPRWNPVEYRIQFLTNSSIDKWEQLCAMSITDKWMCKYVALSTDT